MKSSSTSSIIFIWLVYSSLALFAIIYGVPAQADQMTNSHLYQFDPSLSQNHPANSASDMLVTDESGATIEIQAAALAPDAVAPNWWLTSDNLEICVVYPDQPCN